MSSMQSFDVNSVIDFEGDYYTEVNGYQVPQNIRHRFRSLITSELLSDRDKVERDKNELEYINIKHKTPI
jgi:predicted transcriptional regulator